MTPTPLTMPPRRRHGRQPLPDGGPLVAGHHQALRDIAAGLITRDTSRDHGWRWVWPGLDVAVSQPLVRFLDELHVVGALRVDGGEVRVVGREVAA